MFLYLSVHTQKTRRSGSETKKRRSLSFDQPLIGVKVSLIMDGRTSDLHSHLIRKYIPANKRPLSEVLGKFTETIPVSLIHSCQLMLFLYAARSTSFLYYCCFWTQRPKPLVRAEVCSPPAEARHVSTASNQQRCGGLECGDGTLGHYNARDGADLITAAQHRPCLLTLKVNPASLRPVKDRVYVTQISTMDRAFTNVNRKCKGVVNYGVPSLNQFCRLKEFWDTKMQLYFNACTQKDKRKLHFSSGIEKSTLNFMHNILNPILYLCTIVLHFMHARVNVFFILQTTKTPFVNKIHVNEFHPQSAHFMDGICILQ